VAKSLSSSVLQIRESSSDRGPYIEGYSGKITGGSDAVGDIRCFFNLSPGVMAGPVVVPAGDFQMGCSIGDGSCEKDEGPSGGLKIAVPKFSIDTHEVAVDKYRQCIEAGRCSTSLTNKRNKYCNFDARGRGEHPVNCIDWKQALAYCEWKGGRLPYEAEWEKAARAGSKTRYFWGNEVSCKEAVLDEVSPVKAAKEPDGCGHDTTWPVASRKANALGLYGMHGNVGEWIMSWYAGKSLAGLYQKGDLKGPEKGVSRVVRGGSYDG